MIVRPSLEQVIEAWREWRDAKRLAKRNVRAARKAELKFNRMLVEASQFKQMQPLSVRGRKAA